MSHANKFRWISAARSHVGMVRRINEDACIEQPERGLWAVADGMGGHSLGDVASGMVIEALRNLPSPGSLSEAVSDARDQLQAVNRQLRTEAATRNVQIIGSTIVALLAFERQCGYLWAGDSRLYLYRNGRLTLLTRDHNQLEELRARGALVPEDTPGHPSRNMITRAVGAAETLELDEDGLQVEDGDMFLLCSDGLSNEVGTEELKAALSGSDCAQVADNLIEMALKGGGRDNISAVVVRAEDPYSGDKTALNPAL